MPHRLCGMLFISQTLQLFKKCYYYLVHRSLDPINSVGGKSSLLCKQLLWKNSTLIIRMCVEMPLK